MAYWKMEEASGTRADATGNGNDLDTPINTPAQVTGIIGKGIGFTASSSQLIKRADTANLSFGDVDFSIVTWIKVHTITGSNTYPFFISKRETGAYEYNIQFQDFAGGGTNKAFSFYVYGTSDGVTGADVIAATFGSIPLDTWCMVYCYHDHTANTLGISVNNGTVDTTSYSGGCNDGTSDFSVGALETSLGVYVQYVDGAMDEVGIWRRLLTTDEVTKLYNGGAGLTYPFGNNSNFLAFF